MAYAEKRINKVIADRVNHLPDEIKEEVHQEILIRVWRAYQRLDDSGTWRKFIQEHVAKGVHDYMRSGKGFQEEKWEKGKSKAKVAIPDPDTEETETVDTDDVAPETESADVPTEPIQDVHRFKQRLSHRMEVVNSEDNSSLDVGDIAGLCGVHSGPISFDDRKFNWDLIARMAKVDPRLHLFAKYVAGSTQEEMAADFGVSRERLSQRLLSFDLWLDNECQGNPWARQALFAFDLEEAYGIPPHERGDMGLGWENEPVDLSSKESLSLMSLFKQEKFDF